MATRNARTLIVSCCLVGLAAPAVGQSIRYVDDDAPPSGNGQTWAAAYDDLQEALAEASTNGLISQVRVAGGTYRPDCMPDPCIGTNGDRHATFQLLNGVTIKGGYAGLGAPNPDARNIELYETILTGDLDGDDGPDFANNDENSYHVVTGSGVDRTAVLDGLTVTGGNADAASPNDRGAGVYNDAGNPKLRNCTITLNSVGSDAHPGSGGGICDQNNSNPRLINCTLIANQALTENYAGYGGGMYNHGSSPTLDNCVFASNTAGDGGGIYNHVGSSPTLTDCDFGNNTDYGSAGGMFNSDNSSPTLTNCTFSGNWTEFGGNGGGMRNDNSNPALDNCTFSGNSAFNGHGGGMYNNASSPVLSECTFSGNGAAEGGGGMYSENDSSPWLTGCVFHGNSTGPPEGMGGGGMYNSGGAVVLVNCMFSGNTVPYYDGPTCPGGGMRSADCNLTLIDCTFSGNSAWEGGGMYNSGGLLTLTRCMFRGNFAQHAGGGASNSSSDLTVTSCLFIANTAYDQGGGMYNSGGTLALTNCVVIGNFSLWTGGVENWDTSATLTNCTIAANGGDEWSGGVGELGTGTLTLANCILWGNISYGLPGTEFDQVFGGNVTYSCIEGCSSYCADPDRHNIGDDPLFVDADGPDGFPGNGDDILRLWGGSPCNDAGDSTLVPPDVADLDGDGDTAEPTPFDVEGARRFFNDPDAPNTGVPGAPGAWVDMGAYEYHLPGDFDGNYALDDDDYWLFVAAFGYCAGELGYRTDADLDIDGCVTFIDYQLWVQLYREANPLAPPKPGPQGTGSHQRGSAVDTVSR